jgi:hypothetical protein
MSEPPFREERGFVTDDARNAERTYSTPNPVEKFQ